MTPAGVMYLAGLLMAGPVALFLLLTAARPRLLAWSLILLAAAVLVPLWFLMLERRWPFGHDVHDAIWSFVMGIYTLPVLGGAVAQAVRPFLRDEAYWSFVLTSSALVFFVLFLSLMVS